MSDATISFYEDGKFLFGLPSSLESLDYCSIRIPSRHIDQIARTTGIIEIKIAFLEAENEFKGD